MLGKSLLFLVLLLRTCTVSAQDNHPCEPSFCGNINISSPFRLKTDRKGCGYGEYELSCENSHTVLYLGNHDCKYFVQSINYDNFTIRIVDVGLQEGNCSSMPHSSFKCYENRRPDYGFSYFDYTYDELSRTVAYVECANEIDSPLYTKTFPCVESQNSSSAFSRIDGHPYIVDAQNASSFEASCTIRLLGRTSWPKSRSHDRSSYEDIHKELAYGFELSWCSFVQENGTCNVQFYPENTDLIYTIKQYTWPFVWIPDKYKIPAVIELLLSPIAFLVYPPYGTTACKLPFQDTKVPVYLPLYGIATYKLPFQDMKDNFSRIKRFMECFIVPFLKTSRLMVGGSRTKHVIGVPAIILFIITRTVGLLCVVILLIYKWRRRHRAVDENIEEFLENQKKLFPIRYSYSHIKKITRNFKDRLGEGGYGSVYKGRLRSGQDVAIKVLKNSKANGQDFINEVATIGRIHHVNIVQLVGFCVEGSKRALVYDFMPNGSLDKHIFSKEDNTSLGCKEIYEISLGVARGIEYLHKGCGMQILHFDIKPHNILLDKTFIPKISDFGLAKHYPTNYNTLSLTAARGTLGYMAPELVYKTIGRVSHKVDVYSFGKLLMEMAARRKNVDATIEHSSQVYFPSWVYDQLIKGNHIETVNFENEEDKNITIKMMIVSLWCVQMNPDDRPTMHEVLKMLEEPRNMVLPRKPLLYPPEALIQISNSNTNFELLESSSVSNLLSLGDSSNRSGDIIEEISLV